MILIFIRLKFGVLIIQKNILLVVGGQFHLKDLQHNKIVMMIKTQDHLVGICKIKVVFWLKKEMLIDIVISINNYSLELMVIGRSNWFYPHIHLLIQMGHKLHLMVIQIVLDVLDHYVLVVLNQFLIRKHIILMFVVILFIKMDNGNKENVIIKIYIIFRY